MSQQSKVDVVADGKYIQLVRQGGWEYARRKGISDDELPGSWPPRARDVLVRTRALATLVQLASSSTGGAVDSREAEARAAVLRDLARVVRRARVAAYNAYGQG